MIAYLADKKTFLTDAPSIQDVVKRAVHEGLGLSVGENEYRAWQNSLGNAMFHVMNHSGIPGDAGVAIEYRMSGRSRRVDFIVTGENGRGHQQMVIIELKQWTDIQEGSLPDHVRTFMGGAKRDYVHPSYQAWSYRRQFEDFYTVVNDDPIEILSCSYVHNCDDDEVLRASEFDPLNRLSPVFIKGEHEQLSEFISSTLVSGDSRQTVLRLDDSTLRPSKHLVDALQSMMKGNQEFVLIDEQKTAYEVIRLQASKALTDDEKQVIIVNGGPGTGKSVVAINALVDLLQDNFNARYVTKNAAPRTVYQKKLKGWRSQRDISNLFVSSGSFLEMDSNEFDVLIVDEAHRLAEKSGLYKNLGENQIKEIIAATRTSVFFIDESQAVTWEDAGTVESIRHFASLFHAEVVELELPTQFRCSGANEYMNWVDSTLGLTGEDFDEQISGDFEIEVLGSVHSLYEKVLEKNQERNRARMVAGYCWNWVSKKSPSKFDLVFPDASLQLRWNLTSYGNNWIVSPESVKEVGCIHTAQGLEVDYVGVIIGADLKVVDGALRTFPEARARTDASLKGFKKALDDDAEWARSKADRLIRNTYRTLMSRGARGCYIYCVDPRTAEYFKESLMRARKERNDSRG